MISCGRKLAAISKADTQIVINNTN